MKQLLTLLSICTLLSAAPILLEAEDGLLEGLTVYTEVDGYSGTGYVGNFSNQGSDQVTVTATVPTEGSYELAIIYYTGGKYKEQTLLVNGENSGKIMMDSVPGFDTVSMGGVWLNEGENSIAVLSNWGWAYVDAFILEERKPNVYNPTPNLIDQNATAEAKALYARLCKNYGSKILSGVHDTRVDRDGEYAFLDSLESVVGTKPAVFSFDFSDYGTLNPYLWQNGEHVLGYVGDLSRETEGIINWDSATGGFGIVEITWHWHAPIAEQAGQNNFMADNVAFDVREAVKEGTPENLKVLEDIDSIAAQMRRLADRNIPVLWRPLHEAGGGWFWWGAQGPEAAKALWDLLYDRMVTYHDLHNMIWVWSTPEEDWYPGNDKVDIIGFDSYPDPLSHGSQKSMFDQLYDIVDGEKIVAMTENGPIPNMDALKREDAMWAWWSTWAGLTFEQNSTEHLITVYNHDNVIDLADSAVVKSVVDLKQNTRPSVQLRHLGKQVFIAGYTTGRWDLLTMQGKVVRSDHSATISTKGLASGVYHLQLQGLSLGKIVVP